LYSFIKLNSILKLYFSENQTYFLYFPCALALQLLLLYFSHAWQFFPASCLFCFRFPLARLLLLLGLPLFGPRWRFLFVFIRTDTDVLAHVVALLLFLQLIELACLVVPVPHPEPTQLGPINMSNSYVSIS